MEGEWRENVFVVEAYSFTTGTYSGFFAPNPFLFLRLPIQDAVLDHEHGSGEILGMSTSKSEYLPLLSE